ncbi:MAG TPA: hypothetical protein VNN72_23045 [Polyangiaceae bacterium]|nr:hypothetical protein [Polyangiaceae bacterium]
MTENDPKLTTLAALLLATVVLPPLVAATVLRGEPEAPKPHAAFCADAGTAPKAALVPVRPTKPAEPAPLLACGPVSAVSP